MAIEPWAYLENNEVSMRKPRVFIGKVAYQRGFPRVSCCDIGHSSSKEAREHGKKKAAELNRKKVTAHDMMQEKQAPMRVRKATKADREKYGIR